MNAGAGLGLLTLAIIVLSIGVHPFTRKVTNTYWFWLAYGIAMITLVIVYRWGLDIRDFINAVKDGTTSENFGIKWSKAFLLDMCPMCAVALHAVVIVDPTRKSAKLVAPMAIFGGVITIFGWIIFGGDNPEWTYEYIFIVKGPNRAFFLIHFINLVSGVLVLLNTPKFNFKTFSLEFIVNAGFFMYVAIIILISNGEVKQNVTGILIYDWSHNGEYHTFAEVLNCPPVLGMLFGYSACIAAVTLFSGTQVLLQKAKPYQISNEHNKDWYKGLKGWYKIEPYTKNKYLTNV